MPSESPFSTTWEPRQATGSSSSGMADQTQKPGALRGGGRRADGRQSRELAWKMCFLVGPDCPLPGPPVPPGPLRVSPPHPKERRGGPGGGARKGAIPTAWGRHASGRRPGPGRRTLPPGRPARGHGRTQHELASIATWVDEHQRQRPGASRPCVPPAQVHWLGPPRRAGDGASQWQSGRDS